MTMKDKIISIAASVFGIEERLINENSSPDTIENWDSLNHMNLIVALEEEYSIEFEEEEIIDLMSIKALINSISTKTA